jgi:DNA repair protein RadA/Sms
MGRCQKCSQWNTFADVQAVARKKRFKALKPKNIKEISFVEDYRYVTKIPEMDRVLGGGLVKGSLVLLGGQPGVGKSTLIGGLLKKINQRRILYVSGEESETQIGQRLKRLNVKNENVEIACECKWEAIRDYVHENPPDLLVIDSIQTTYSEEIQSSPGSSVQVKEVTYRLMTEIKSRGITCIVIGHINKDGGIAGPKILEHMVDTVIYFEGDREGQLRILRAIKNRFGVNNEIGLFEMTPEGLKTAAPKTLIQNQKEKIGTVLTSIIEGSRNMIIEVQSLVSKYEVQSPKRISEGMDLNRLQMLLAILEKYLPVNCASRDVFLNITGGFRVRDGNSDLTVMASILSSLYDIKLSTDMVFIGEVGLCGEIRPLPNFDDRLKNLELLGIKKVITSKENVKSLKSSYSQKIYGLERVEHLNNFIKGKVA